MSTIADKSTKSYHSNCFSSYADDRNKKKLQNVWNVWPEHDDTTKQQFIGKTARQSAINKNLLDEVLLVDGFTIIIFILCILCLFQFLANNMFFQFDQFHVCGSGFYSIWPTFLFLFGLRPNMRGKCLCVIYDRYFVFRNFWNIHLIFP